MKHCHHGYPALTWNVKWSPEAKCSTEKSSAFWKSVKKKYFQNASVGSWQEKDPVCSFLEQKMGGSIYFSRIHLKYSHRIMQFQNGSLDVTLKLIKFQQLSWSRTLPLLPALGYFQGHGNCRKVVLVIFLGSAGRWGSDSRPILGHAGLLPGGAVIFPQIMECLG